MILTHLQRVRRSPFSSLRSLSSQTSTLPSTTPSLSSSRPPLPPPSPLSSLPLYSATHLPPLPPPLPQDISASDIFTSSSIPLTSATEASNSEQLAVLNACLANGDVNRAEEVAGKIAEGWEGTGRGKLELVASVLGPKVHAEFLRAYLMKVLDGNAGGWVPRSKTNLVGKNEGIRKSWAYLNPLIKLQEETPKRVLDKFPLVVDSMVLATFLKGLVLARTLIGEKETNRYGGGILALLEVGEGLGIGFGEIVSEGVWELGEHYLGVVGRKEVVDVVEEEVRKAVEEGAWKEETERWAKMVKSVRKKLEKEEVEAKDDTVGEELRPTFTKDSEISMNLSTLRQNLSHLSMDSLRPPLVRQALLEKSTYEAAQQLYIHEQASLSKLGLGLSKDMKNNWLSSQMLDWVAALKEKLEEEVVKGSWGKDKDLAVDPFLKLLKPEMMALVTVVELLRLCGGSSGPSVGEGMKATRAMLHIGRAIENEYHARLLKEGRSMKEIEKELEKIEIGSEIGNRDRALDIMWKKEFEKKQKEGDLSWTPGWSQNIRSKVGGILVKALIETAKVERTVVLDNGIEVTESQEAFSHSYQYVKGLKLGVFKVNPAVSERLDLDPLRIALNPRFLPMIVKPKPWLAWNSGSYLLHKTSLVRTKDSKEQLDYLRQASSEGTLDRIFAGLDVLGGVPWKINQPVFEVVCQVWNSGENLADIPAPDTIHKPLDVEKPDGFETDPRAKDTFRRRVRKVLQERRADHSNRCDVNYKLEIGKAFLDETIYFPHNLDFRGRAYPIPPNLSHIGNDLCRGILTFAERKPLGERGLRWLKIHLANMTGYDKANFDEREARAMEHLEDVFDSADNPLTGKRWWLTAEAPWQCLATCMELAAALRSPVPTEFLSSLPIHQDGTCNGLQHYAALGGDLEGAHQVNLDGGDRPSDVYSGVARMANEVVDKAAAEGNLYATLLQGKISRKVVKQTVMTTVYGVTFIGAKRQIEKQLKERGDIPAEHLYGASLYLGRIVLDSIGTTFKGATAIQTWLHRSARLIAKSIPPHRIAAAKEPLKSNGKSKKAVSPTMSRIAKEQMTSVVWTTPLGLPVCQPYRKPKKRQVATALQTVFIVDPSIVAEVDPRAQATAFPPNFIHSLDATHMMMTALECKDKIAFASVHDSYWTHACSVDEMSIMLRDTFIKLHSSDVLGELRKEFLTRYAGHVVPVAKARSAPRKKSPKTVEATSEEDEPVEEEEDVSPNLDKDAVEWEKLLRLSKADLTVADPWETPSTSSQLGSLFIPIEDLIPPVPLKGNFDLGRIRDSLYFFS